MQRGKHQWFWFDKLSNSWIKVSNSDQIEEEYIEHVRGIRCGQRVYHCFGNGGTALINFETMTTCCGSGRCMLTHDKYGLSDDHMTYQLKSELII